jgi:methionyl-tRNA synthetase
LQPRSITRDLDWGVPIPDSEIPPELKLDHSGSKRLYVWFEAVIGYLSASVEWANAGQGRSWESFWKGDNAKHYYFMGKDNLVFHTLFWPGQLHSFDETLRLPDVPAINQFLTFGGQKFSKSRGVMVTCQELVERFGLDPVRFHLACIAPEEADSSFTYEEYIGKHNSVLIANIGNFINRTLKLSLPVDFSQSIEVEPEVKATIEAGLKEAHAALEGASIRSYAEALISLSAAANKFITVKSPWLIKDRTDPSYIKTMHCCMGFVLTIGALFVPLMPETAAKLGRMLGVEFARWPDFAEIEKLLRSVKISEPQALFVKLEELKAEGV